MIGRSASDGWFSPVKAKLAKVKVFDKSVNDPDCAVFGNIIFQIPWKQDALHSVIAFNELFHLTSSICVASALFYKIIKGTTYVLIRTVTFAEIGGYITYRLTDLKFQQVFTHSFNINAVSVQIIVNYLTALLINLVYSIFYSKLSQYQFSLLEVYMSLKENIVAVLAISLSINAVQTFAERFVIVNDRLLNEIEIRYLDNLSCTLIPNGRYWLNMNTGIWGYKSGGAQGHISDNCQSRRPNLSERGLLYSPGELLR